MNTGPYCKNSKPLGQFVTSLVVALGVLAGILGGMTSDAAAFQLTLEWDKNPETNITGYRLYYGFASGQYTTSVNAGNQTTCTLTSLTDGKTHYFAVTALNPYGESGYSNEVKYTPTSTNNHAPVASSTNLSVIEDTAKPGTLSATDADGNSLTFSIVAQPSKGSVAQTGSTNAFVYTPNANATGSDSFTFRASDGSLNSNTATISITISGVNDAPIANADTAATTKDQPVTISVLANDTDVEGSILSLVSASDGSYGTTSVSGTTLKYSPNTGSITRTVTDSFTYRVSDGQQAATGTVHVTVYADSSGSVVMAINAGGGQYTASDGTVYQADGYYSGGSTYSKTAAIEDTTDDVLYQTERFGNVTYTIPVSSGEYMLTLKFAEIYWDKAEKRLFDVVVEGQQILDNLDVAASVGCLRAYDISIPVTILDGRLDVVLRSVVDNAKLSAILLREATSSVVHAVNAGGGSFTDSASIQFSADTGFTGGSVCSTTAGIAGTDDETLYRTERFGNFTYNIPLAPGAYFVTLKFAEIYWNAPGKRVFDVLIEGNEVISDLDLFARFGPNVAYDYVELVNVSDGALNIQFRTDIDRAKVSAILIESSN